MSEEPDGILQRILDRIDERPEIVGVVMTGSRARSDGTVDDYSDHDLELFVVDPTGFDTDDWVREIGKVWVSLPLTSDEGYPVRLVSTGVRRRQGEAPRTLTHSNKFSRARPPGVEVAPSCSWW